MTTPGDAPKGANTTPPAEAVARLTAYLASHQWAADTRQVVSMADDDECLTFGDLRTLLAAYADAARDRELLARVSACKGFDVAYHFLANPPVWVVTDTNLDDEEYAAPTLTEALSMLADKYDAARTGEAR